MPKFTTVLPGKDEAGNIFNLLGNARRLLRQLGVPEADIKQLTDDVFNSHSYKEACGHIEKWFTIDHDLEA